MGPNGWFVEIFLGFHDILEEDLIRVIEESRSPMRIIAPFNATFIAFILKFDNPSPFEEYIPISLCNCIYKFIAKIIARRVKRLLLKTISNE